MARGTRGAYRKEDRVALPPDLQKELVEKAAAKYGNCQELAKYLDIPKSSVHYYRIGRLTMPESVLERMLELAGDPDLRQRIACRRVTKDRTWANEHAVSVYREMCRDAVRLPTKDELHADGELRRAAAAIISYVMAEGSVWLQKERWGECAANITFGSHELDLYNHFRFLCQKVFRYDIGPPQMPGNGARAIRGFIYSRFIAEWLMENGVHPGEKSAVDLRLPSWVLDSDDRNTWLAAIQPWCDGEGSISINPKGRPIGFAMLQSRHTDLDFGLTPMVALGGSGGRTLSSGCLRALTLCDISVDEYCASLFRSRVLEDLATLLRRLGFHPRISIACLFLKQDGFWSCHWNLRIPSCEVPAMIATGMITQERKRARATSG
jgi:hypothetical protein